MTDFGALLGNVQSWQVYATAGIVIFCALYLRQIYDFIRYRIELSNAFKRVDGPKTHWFWGHSKIYPPDETGILERRYTMKEFPKIQYQQYGPLMRTVNLYFPSLVGTLLSADYPKDIDVKKFFYAWIGDGLLLSHGKKWQRNRKLLTPAFHFDILKNYVQVFNESVDIMESKLGKTEKAIDVFEPVSLMALDSMLRCMMSYKSNCQELGQSHPYVKAIHDLAEGIIKRFFLLPFTATNFVFDRMEMGKKFNAAVKIANDQTTTVIQNRINTLKSEENSKSKNKRKHDFLDILLLAKDSNGNGLSEKEIRDEVDTFLFEGHDTTASGISWILYDLATNPDHQKKCREEVNSVLEDRDYVEWEDLSKFNHLTLCIKESMRIHPPVPFISRNIDRPIKFDRGFGKDQYNLSEKESVDGAQEFPAHSMLEMPIIHLHHNPHVWKNPDRFDPYRFTKENFAKQPHFSYIPFSAGPRNCIGQNFAMMEIKITLAKCLKHFDFYVDDDCPKPCMMPRLVLKSETGIMIKFKPIPSNG